MLCHFEEALGPLCMPRSAVRALLLFQDPRGEKRFELSDPAAAAHERPKGTHRYFCLTQEAWQALRLDAGTGSPIPRWPAREDAYMYLRRYLGVQRSWSYDGLIAYFLQLLRPADALVTNVIKCHFGRNPTVNVFKTCAQTHLTTEVAILRPNLVLCFGSAYNGNRLTCGVPALAGVTQLCLLHPAARGSARKVADRFSSEIERTAVPLMSLGLDVRGLLNEWIHDVEEALRKQKERGRR